MKLLTNVRKITCYCLLLFAVIQFAVDITLQKGFSGEQSWMLNLLTQGSIGEHQK